MNQQHIWAAHLNMQTSDMLFITQKVYGTTITLKEIYCAVFSKPSPLFAFVFFYVHFSGVKVFVDGGGCMCLVGATNCLVVKLKSKFLNHGIMNN